MQITVDPSKRYQVLEGFGASHAWWAQAIGGWPAEKQALILKRLFDRTEGIGLTIARYNIGGGAGQEIKDDWRRTETFEVEKDRYDWSRDANAISVLKQAVALGVEQVYVFANTPPSRMTISGYVTGGINGESNLHPDKVDEFAQYLVDVAHHLCEAESIPVYAISPINEPQWDWNPTKGQEGCHYTPEESVVLTRALVQKLAERGSRIKVSVIDSDRWAKSEEYIEPLLNNPLLQKALDHFAIHSYWSGPEEKRRITAYMQEKYPTVPLMMTEWTEMVQGRDAGMDSALVLANEIHDDLTLANVISWQYWIAVSKYDFRDGLLYVDPADQTITETKRLWAFGNYSRFIRPGFTRVEAAITASSPLKVTVWQGSDAWVLVVINNEAAPVTVDLALPEHREAQVYETSEACNLQQVYAGNAIDQYTFAAQSVTTVVLL